MRKVVTQYREPIGTKATGSSRLRRNEAAVAVTLSKEGKSHGDRIKIVDDWNSIRLGGRVRNGDVVTVCGKAWSRDEWPAVQQRAIEINAKRVAGRRDEMGRGR